MRGFFSIGIFNPKFGCNQGTLWRSAYAFGAAQIFTVGKRFERQASDTASAYKHVPMVNYTDVDDLIEHLPYGCRLIGVELAADARPLATYCHPERAAYLLGSEDGGLPPKVIERCHALVQVPNLRMCLNVAVAGTLVLYDRATKSRSCVSK